MDPLLTKAKVISNSSRYSLADTKVGEEGKAEGAQDTEQRFPCRPWGRFWWDRLSSCSPWISMAEQEFTGSPWEPPHWNRWLSKGGSDTVGIPCWSRLLASLWTHEDTPHWSRFTGSTGDHPGDPLWNSLFLKDCTLWKGLTLEHFVKNCRPCEGEHELQIT